MLLKNEVPVVHFGTGLSMCHSGLWCKLEQPQGSSDLYKLPMTTRGSFGCWGQRSVRDPTATMLVARRGLFYGVSKAAVHQLRIPMHWEILYLADILTSGQLFAARGTQKFAIVDWQELTQSWLFWCSVSRTYYYLVYFALCSVPFYILLKHLISSILHGFNIQNIHKIYIKCFMHLFSYKRVS